jgi:transposase
VKVACEKAHVSRQVFYDWKPRFEADGYGGLEKSFSRAPRKPQKTPATIAEQVIALKQEHPEYGKRRIADELMKANHWRPVISPNTVMRILKEHGLAPVSQASKKKDTRRGTYGRKARTNRQH